MAEHRIVIDPQDRSHFFMLLDDSGLTLGARAEAAELFLRPLKIRRIRCEIEFEEDRVTLNANTADAPEVTLTAGEKYEVGTIRLEVSSLGTAAAGLQLQVIDGADAGKVFAVLPSGITRIGKNARNSQVVLHDLYVSQVHCQIETEGNEYYLSHLEGPGGTQLNRRRLEGRQQIIVGDIIRVGNTSLRLERGLGDKVERGSGERPALRPSSHEALRLPDLPPEPVREPTPIERVLQLENQSLGHFKLGRVLGVGHLGAVFQATDTKHDLTIGLKVLSPEFPAEEAELARFAKVLKAAPGLRNTHLLSLYGVGKIGPFTWISREYVEGRSLYDQIGDMAAAGKLHWKSALTAAVQVARALDFLHGCKVTHGNVTPSNLLVVKEDKTIKLADTLLWQALAQSELMTAVFDKKQRGELSFRAPEQLDADMPEDHRVDLFALGSIAYWMMEGRAPFGALNPEEMLEKIREKGSAKLSKRPKDMPPVVESAVLRLLSAEPNERFPTAGAFLEVVEPIVMMFER